MLQILRGKVTLNLLLLLLLLPLLPDVSIRPLENLGRCTMITDSIRHGGTNEC